MQSFSLSNGIKVGVISGRRDRADHICDLLERCGLHAEPADFTTHNDVLLFDLAHCSPKLVADMSDITTQNGLARPILAALGHYSDRLASLPDMDVHLSTDAALTLAPLRFQFARRMLSRRAELELRHESFRRHGVHIASPPLHSHRPLIYVGDPSLTFPQLQLILQSRGESFQAAFSCYTAYDYVTEEDFGAVLLEVKSDSERAETFCQMVEKSPNLANLPILAIVEPGSEIPPTVRKSVSDIIENDAGAQAICNQLVKLAQISSNGEPPIIPADTRLSDPETGLFRLGFFADHLQQQLRWARESRQQISLLIIQVYNSDGSRSTSADLTQCARLMRSLLRAQDTPARIDTSLLAVSLPGASESYANIAARRLTDVLDATAFEPGYGEPARQLIADYRIISPDPDIGAEAVIELIRSAHQKSRGYAA